MQEGARDASKNASEEAAVGKRKPGARGKLRGRCREDQSRSPCGWLLSKQVAGTTIIFFLRQNLTLDFHNTKLFAFNHQSEIYPHL